MNRSLAILSLLFAAMLLIGGCASELECEPVVVSTDIDYTLDPLSVPYGEIHEIFAETYSGEDLSVDLRAELIDRMCQLAEEISEDPQTLRECIVATYPDWNERPNRIPCYAEKCIYLGQAIWAIAFNRANSFDETTLSHFDLYFVSCSSHEVLYNTGCF